MTPTTDTENETAEQVDARSDVEKLRDKQLADGEVTGARKRAAQKFNRASPAEQRTGVPGAKPIAGRVDNMTRRDDRDVLEGHFCLIDFAEPEHGADARKGVEALLGEGNAHAGSGDYGVYLSAASIGDDGYPLDALVLLRDEHSGQVTVPYGALRPAPQGGRR